MLESDGIENLCKHAVDAIFQSIHTDFSIHKSLSPMSDVPSSPQYESTAHRQVEININLFKWTTIEVFILTFSSNTNHWYSCLTCSCSNKQHKGMRGCSEKITYIICVDVPCHVTIGNKLSVNIASDFAVPPAAVDVNYTDHVPLGKDSQI